MTRNARWLLAAAAVILIIGVVATRFASDQPDGLEFVAEQEGFADTAQDHTLSDTALADYGENLDGSAGTNTVVAALVGLTATTVIAGGLFWLARTNRDHGQPSGAA